MDVLVWSPLCVSMAWPWFAVVDGGGVVVWRVNSGESEKIKRPASALGRILARTDFKGTYVPVVSSNGRQRQPCQLVKVESPMGQPAQGTRAETEEEKSWGLSVVEEGRAECEEAKGRWWFYEDESWVLSDKWEDPVVSQSVSQSLYGLLGRVKVWK